MNTKRGIAGIRWWMIAVTMAFLFAGSAPNAQAGRDRGVNQPGAAGNRGGGSPGRPVPSTTLGLTSPERSETAGKRSEIGRRRLGACRCCVLPFCVALFC